MPLFFKKYGNEGTPLIILHGLFGMSDNWHNAAKELSSNFIVYTLDLRNHGQSPHLPAMNYTLMAEDVNDFMDEEHISKAIIVGHSMGGKAAIQFAMMFPERLLNLVVVDIAPKTYPAGHSKYFDAMRSINFNASGRKEIETDLSAKIPDQGELLFILKNLYRKEDNSYGLKLNLVAIESNYHEIIGGIDIETPINTPTCFIKGERSRYILPEDETMIKNQFTNVHFISVANAGHWVHAENMPGFLDALRSCLE